MLQPRLDWRWRQCRWAGRAGLDRPLWGARMMLVAIYNSSELGWGFGRAFGWAWDGRVPNPQFKQNGVIFQLVADVVGKVRLWPLFQSLHFVPACSAYQ